MKTSVIVSHRLITLEPTAELQKDKDIKLLHINILFWFFPTNETLTFESYTWMCTFETSGVVKPYSFHSYATEVWTSRGKTEWCKNPLCKSWSLHVRPYLHRLCASWPLPNCRATASPACFHFVFVSLSPSQDWSWPAPALAVCPRRTVTCGNAWEK